jgi:D-alanyl-D-alanine dipeptidase
MRRQHLFMLAALSCLVAALAACQPAPKRPAATTAAAAPQAAASPLAGARQMLVVVAEDFSANQARMRRFERAGDGPWRPVGDDVAVTLGKNGLAWGRGISGEPPAGGPVKVEGDGRSPAGVFTFSTAFAYRPEDLWQPSKMPMHRVTSETICVESINSKEYNRILDENTVAVRDWDRPDHMLRPDGLYRYGLMVNHNAPDTKPGSGSCILMHLWRRPGAPTAGCTAMNEPAMLAVQAWIDASKKPILVQLPRAELERLAPLWGAPEIVAAMETKG